MHVRLTHLAIAACVALVGVLIPTSAGAVTAGPASPSSEPTRSGDMVIVPGIAPTPPRRAPLSGTRGVAPAATVETVWVSVADVNATEADANSSTSLSQAAVQTMVAGLSQYWAAESNGAINIQFGGYETRSIGQSGSCDPNAVASYERANAFGGAFKNYSWQGTHKHLLVLSRESCGGQAFATIGGNGGEIFSGNGTADGHGLVFLLHEFGHNLGFSHGNASVCTNTANFDAPLANFTSTSTVCPTKEYDDFLDVMGYSIDGAKTHLSSVQRILTGWWSNYATATSATPTTSVTLAPLGASSGTQALKIVDPANGLAYYAEYRTKSGADANSAEFNWGSSCSTLSGYGLCSLDSSAASGSVRILRELPNAAAGTSGTTVLATAPLAGSSDLTKRHTHLDAGQSFTPYDAGFTLHVNSVSVSGGASLTVSFGKAAATATTLSLSAPAQTYGTSAVSAQAQVGLVNGSYPAGAFQFSAAGTTLLGTVDAAADGSANFALPATLAAGSQPITARFVPSSQDIAPSTSAPVSVVVAKAPTATSFGLAHSVLSRRSHAVLTLTVASDATTRPFGVVTVYNGSTAIGRYTLSTARQGVLAITLPLFSTSGTKSLWVSFGGNRNLGASHSVRRSLHVYG